VTQDDLLYRFRLRTFAMAAELGNVRAACRAMGIHPSTYYRWKRQLDRYGPEILRPRERRPPRMANQTSPLLEQRVVAFALGHPGFGPARIAVELARPKWGAITLSTNGVWRVLRRHGLNTRARRYALIAGYAAPCPPPREGSPVRHIEVDHPGELVGFDAFFVGRLAGARDPIWQLTAIDVRSSYGWAELVTCPTGQVRSEQTSRFARRVAADLARAGWRLERALTDNGNEWRACFTHTISELDARQTRIRAGRPQTNGHVENLHKTILEECWRPAFARYRQLRLHGLRRDLDHFLWTYNCDRAHTGRLTRGKIPADIIDPARKLRPA
jgi:transposase InsO family protein